MFITAADFRLEPSYKTIFFTTANLSRNVYRGFKGLTLKPKHISPEGNKKHCRIFPSISANTSKDLIVILKVKGWGWLRFFFLGLVELTAHNRVHRNLQDCVCVAYTAPYWLVRDGHG